MNSAGIQNPVMARQIAENPTFSSIQQASDQSRTSQAMRHNYTYSLSDTIAGQVTAPFNMVIEQGSDFECHWMTISAFSFDSVTASTFPAPNAAGLTHWAARGLSMKITDTRSGRELTSGFVPIELLASPGYGLALVTPFTYRYFFYRNSKIRFDIRNRDNANRIHNFEIALNGFKVFTPE